MVDRRKDSTPSQIINPYPYFMLEWGAWFPHESLGKRIQEVFENHPDNRFILLQGTTVPGKTSVLKQIENSPGILGDKYIPIYLDSRKYISTNLYNLPRALYKDIIEKLIKHGYNIPFSDYIEPDKDETTIENIFLRIFSILKPADILIMIFDEFGTLLTEDNIEGISDYIRYIQAIEKNWNNFGLILVVDKIMEKSSRSTIIHRFLNSGHKINLDKFLKEENIRERIVGRVRNILEYDEEAIKKITWYSGKNLYFEQLICYFIVHHLSEENRKQCIPEDVDIVVQQILTDQKDEFNKAWEKELSAELKLIVSALADESVTERRTHIYVLTENNLLDTIFGQKLTEKIEELQQLGYINRIQGKHFPQFPFKIPIYGLFVQKEHPFIRTIIENIDALAHKVDLNLLVEEIVKTSAEKLPLFDRAIIPQLAETWTSLKTNVLGGKSVPDKSQIQPFIESFTTLLKLNDPQWNSNENHFILDIKKLNIGILSEVHCFFQVRPKLSRVDISHIENMTTAVTKDARTRLNLFFYFQASDMIEELSKKPFLTLIAIDENDLKKIMFSKRAIESFRKLILSRLSLQLISPYRTEGPAKETFYGRSDIIYRITRDTDTSYSIVGTRKIGKTSLLYRIKHNPPPNIAYLFISLELEFSGVKSYKTFLKSLERQIEQVFYKKIKFNRFPFVKDVERLPEIFRKLVNTQEKKIALILDEIDDLIEFDKKHKYKLMRIFRIMSNEKNYQFIFAGFKQLYHSKRKHENPMYNFCDEIIMDPLDKQAAFELVTKPMESIGVHYHDQEDRKVILEYTGRHPTLLQFFCKKLIEKIEKHPGIEDRRIIFKVDIEDVFDSEYQEYIIDDIYMFFSDLSDINRLIIMLLVENSLKKRYFTIAEIKGLLTDCGIVISINDLNRNLSELVMRFILLEEKGNYRFTLPIFPVILKKRVDNDFKQKTIKEIKTNG
jgi:hypothetical protein